MKNKYREGDEVYWTDPDNNECSGYYKIIKVQRDGIYLIGNETSEVEVFEEELS